MDEGGGLERVPRRFAGHLVRGQAAKLFIDERQQFLCGLGIALFDGVEKLRHIAHVARV